MLWIRACRCVGRPLLLARAVVLAAVLSACGGATIRLPAGIAPTIQKVVVIPLEPPPIDLAFESDRPKLEAALAAADNWVPTIAIAELAAEQLRSAGIAVVIEHNLRSIPGIESRKITLHMHNWYGPIEDWYRLEVSPFVRSYPKTAGVDAVLEVGLKHYDITHGNLFIVVHLKLVHPTTGKVMARAKDYTAPDISDDLGAMLLDDAALFRRRFAETAAGLVKANLDAMGMLPQ